MSRSAIGRSFNRTILNRRSGSCGSSSSSSSNNINNKNANIFCQQQQKNTTKRFSQNFRLAAMNEISTLRIPMLMLASEDNILRGWDEGFEDDDGG